MSYDDMQFSPPSSAARKRRPAHEELTDASMTRNDNHNPPVYWQHAFKRLRVNDQESNNLYENASSDGSYYSQPPLDEWQSTQQPNYYNNNHHLYSTPPPKPQVHQPPSLPETDYKRNNQALGQLHRERRLREQEQARRLYLHDDDGMGGEHQQYGGSTTTSSWTSHTSEQDYGPGLMMMMESPARPEAVHLFGSTPLPVQRQRRQNAVQLPSDSKLE